MFFMVEILSEFSQNHINFLKIAKKYDSLLNQLTNKYNIVQNW